MSCAACGHHAARYAFPTFDRDHSRAGYAYHVCAGCGTHRLYPMPSDHELEAFYAERPPQRVKRDGWTDVLGLVRGAAVHGGRWLDFGCGTGGLVAAARESGYDASGIDWSEAAVDVAREAFGDHYRQGSVSAICDSEPRSYAVVTALSCIEHLRDPARFVRAAYRALAPGGLLLAQVPTVDSLMFEHLGQHYYWAQAPRHPWLFSRRGLTGMLEDTGFRGVEWRPVRRTWYWTRALADRIGARKAYEDWRALDPDFVRFDRAVDGLLDEIALRAGRSSAAYVLARRPRSA